jgi:hypothetical protein
MLHRQIWLITAILSLLSFLLLSSPTAAQAPRDYMTDDEIELVRDAQDIDERIDVLTKMIDRRFAALKIDAGGASVPVKDTTKWGPAPTGTKTELLDDVKKLLQKAIDDIDNVAAHPVDYNIDKDRSEKQKKKDAQRFPNAVRNLATAAHRYQPPLKTLLDKTTDEREKGLILASLEFCDEIISASSKVTAEAGN